MEKLVAVLYIVSILHWIIGFYRIKKSDSKLNGICFMFASVFTFMCYQTVVALVFIVFKCTICNTAFLIANVLTATVMWYCILKKKLVQEYVYDKKDIIAIVIFAIAVYIVSAVKFSRNLDVFNYECLWDSSVHLQYTRDMARNGSIPLSLYFMVLNVGLLFDSLTAFEPYNTGCTLFVRTDVAMLFMCAGMFWHAVRNRLNDNYMYIAGIIFTILYVFGYPLNNMVFGTSYLGAGNTCVIYLLLITELFTDKKLGKKSFLFMLVLGAYGIAVSYIMFVPVILASIAVYLVVYFYNQKLITPKMIKLGMCIFIPLCVVAALSFYFLYWDSMKTLAVEGQIYRSILSNFVFFIPFMVLAVKKAKLKEMPTIFTVIAIVYVLIFMGCVFLGKVSGYYYYKNYYLLWLACFLCLIYVLERFKEQRTFVNAYFIGWVFLGLMWITNANQYLNQYTDSYYGNVFGTVDTNNLFDLYDFNQYGVKHRPVEPGTREIFEKVASMNAEIDGDVYFIGDYRFALQKQYAAIADQPDVTYFDINSAEELEQKIRENYKYVCVVDPELSPVDLSGFLSTLNVIYSNEKGYIAEVK